MEEIDKKIPAASVETAVCDETSSDDVVNILDSVSNQGDSNHEDAGEAPRNEDGIREGDHLNGKQSEVLNENQPPPDTPVNQNSANEVDCEDSQRTDPESDKNTQTSAGRQSISVTDGSPDHEKQHQPRSDTSHPSGALGMLVDLYSSEEDESGPNHINHENTHTLLAADEDREKSARRTCDGIEDSSEHAPEVLNAPHESGQVKMLSVDGEQVDDDAPAAAPSGVLAEQNPTDAKADSSSIVYVVDSAPDVPMMMDYREETVDEDSAHSDTSDSVSSDEDDKLIGRRCIVVSSGDSGSEDENPRRNRGGKKQRDNFPRTRGELGLKDLPPIEDLKITVDENVEMVEVGTVLNIMDVLVIIRTKTDLPALNEETILFIKDRKVLGQVFETFGPVARPLYSVRYNSPEQIAERGIEAGDAVFYAPKAPEFTHYVFMEHLKQIRGSDASWEHNNEPPEQYLEYSDDEEEKKARQKSNAARKAKSGSEHGGKRRQDWNQRSATTKKAEGPNSCENWPPKSHQQMPAPPSPGINYQSWLASRVQATTASNSNNYNPSNSTQFINNNNRNNVWSSKQTWSQNAGQTTNWQNSPWAAPSPTPTPPPTNGPPSGPPPRVYQQPSVSQFSLPPPSTFPPQTPPLASPTFPQSPWASSSLTQVSAPAPWPPTNNAVFGQHQLPSTPIIQNPQQPSPQPPKRAMDTRYMQNAPIEQQGFGRPPPVNRPPLPDFSMPPPPFNGLPQRSMPGLPNEGQNTPTHYNTPVQTPGPTNNSPLAPYPTSTWGHVG